MPERRLAQGGSVDILNKSGDVIAHYEPHLPNSPESDRGVAHVLLLGEVRALHPKFMMLLIKFGSQTTTSYGEAWGALRFIGTVWPSDGKITILSENVRKRPPPKSILFDSRPTEQPGQP